MTRNPVARANRMLSLGAVHRGRKKVDCRGYRKHRGAILAALLIPVVPLGAEVYSCVEPDGRVTFGDRACPTGETYVQRIETPTSGWNSRSVMEQNSGMLADYESRLRRQRNRPAPTYRGFEDRVRDRELRMARDRALEGVNRSSGLKAYAYGQQARDLNRQRDRLYRNPTGR